MRSVLLPVVAVVTLLPAAARAQIIDRVLAVIGTEVITLTDARAALAFGLVQAPESGDPIRTALTYLIDRQLELGDVDRYSAPEPDRAALDRAFVAVRGRFAAPGDFAAAMARTGMTEDRLRDMIRDDLRIAAYVEQRFAGAAQPTDEDVARYYKEHPAEFTENGRVVRFEQAENRARVRAAAARRRALVSDWIDRLRQRTPVTDLYLAGR